MRRTHIPPAVAGTLLLLLAACSRSSTAPETPGFGTPTVQSANVAVVIHNTTASRVSVIVELAGEAAFRSSVEAGTDKAFTLVSKALESGDPVMFKATSTVAGDAMSCEPLWVRAGSTVEISVTDDGVKVSQRPGDETKPGDRPVS